MLISIVIRTLNESFYLRELLIKIKSQELENFQVETVIIDSGSTDDTLKIAEEFNCRITYISKDDFTFGRSLNLGSKFADGDVLIYISGHCIPCNNSWLKNLVRPIINGKADYVYGKQVGRDTTKFSESMIFEKYFPSYSKLPQDDFFCNNANSAISRDAWNEYKFDEEVTGLEDMELAKRLYANKGKIGYLSDASVYHIHNESWIQTKRRYEREAIAMQKIMPEIYIKFTDLIRYIAVSIISDSKEAMLRKSLAIEIFGIIKFRIAQYYGSYIGNHNNRKLSKKSKEKYFYPKKDL